MLIDHLARRVCPWWLFVGHVAGLVSFEHLVDRARGVVAPLSIAERRAVQAVLVLRRDQTGPGERALFVALSE